MSHSVAPQHEASSPNSESQPSGASEQSSKKSSKSGGEVQGRPRADTSCGSAAAANEASHAREPLPGDSITLADLFSAPSRHVVDVRSPGEFGEDHFPGARSVPLFNDRERAALGTIYHCEGGDPALEWGRQRVLPRLEAYTKRLVEALALESGSSESVGSGAPLPRVVLCARGGQRSRAVTTHLRALGYPVHRLEGGYRSYRTWIRRELDEIQVPGPWVLNGLTGCGKTHLLREIASRFPQQTIDLEGLAGHRSSVLGDIGLQPATQKRFEADLARELRQLQGPWSLFEWEARRIGNREMPNGLYQQLRAAPQIEVCATMEQRVSILTDEYLRCGGIEEVKARLHFLAPYPAIGEDGVAWLETCLENGRVSEAVRFLLEKHYDPRYAHGNRGLTVVKQFHLSTIERTADEIVSWIERSVEARSS